MKHFHSSSPGSPVFFSFFLSDYFLKNRSVEISRFCFGWNNCILIRHRGAYTPRGGDFTPDVASQLQGLGKSEVPVTFTHF